MNTMDTHNVAIIPPGVEVVDVCSNCFAGIEMNEWDWAAEGAEEGGFDPQDVIDDVLDAAQFVGEFLGTCTIVGEWVCGTCCDRQLGVTPHVFEWLGSHLHLRRR